MTEMLQKTENVAKNVANKNSQDLTEQWKKGVLPSGWYYVQLQEGVYADNVKSIIMDYYTDFCDFMKHPYLIEQVLAPVPSYDEYLESEAHCVVMRELYDAEKEKNAQLKELLKECKPYIALYTENNKHIGFTPETANLLQRIKEVLK